MATAFVDTLRQGWRYLGFARCNIPRVLPPGGLRFTQDILERQGDSACTLGLQGGWELVVRIDFSSQNRISLMSFGFGQMDKVSGY